MMDSRVAIPRDASATRTDGGPAPVPARARVLCVDDEPAVLEGLAANLSRRYEFHAAQSAFAGLDLIERDGPFAVVVSDLRMPGMDGASFLAQVRQRAPDTIRILLTGFADVGAAIAAVNEGQIFRFLTKPCASPVLRTAIDAGIEQNRLITAERVLLEQTLRGSIRMLVDALALANPTAYGRAVRIKNYATEFADALGVTSHWRIDVAAMLSQVGAIALPADVSQKLGRRMPLDTDERMQVERLPSVAAALLENVPRLDDIRAILRAASEGSVGNGATSMSDDVRRDAAILMIADAFELEEAQGAAPVLALTHMRASGSFDSALLDEFARLHVDTQTGHEVRDIPLRYAQEGMQLAADVRDEDGEILLPRGLEITRATIARILAMPTDFAKKLVPVRITLP